ncbi:MAG: TlpA family protein disulfide reductase [Thermoguttaceae bacterium]
MQRCLYVILLFVLSVQLVSQKAFAADFVSLTKQIHEITEQPFTGSTPEDLLEFLSAKGDAFEKCADEILALEDATQDNKGYAYQIKGPGIALKYGADPEQYYEKLHEFVSSLPDSPENLLFVKRAISILFYSEVENLYLAHNNGQEKIAESYRTLVDKYAPLINKYFINQNVRNNGLIEWSFTYYADSFDPFGKEGLVVYAVEKIMPALDAQEQNNSNAWQSKCMVRRYQMLGKELEFRAADIDENIYDVKDDRGKVVIIFTSESSYNDKLPALKKLYETLKDEPFVMLHYDENLSVADLKKFVDQNAIPWKNLCRDARYKLPNMPRLEETYGLGACFIVDKEGKVVLTSSRQFHPEYCFTLKDFFPQHAAALDEIAAEIKAVDDITTEKQKEYYASQSDDTTTTGKIYSILTRLNIGNTKKITNQICDFLSDSDHLSKLMKIDVPSRKLEALSLIAIEKFLNNTQLHPQLALKDLFEYAEKSRPLYDDLRYSHYPDYCVINTLNTLLAYAATVEDRVEFAKGLSDCYVNESIQYIAYYNESIFNDFTHSLNSMVSLLEELDDEHDTELVQPFLNRIIPLLAISGKPELENLANELETAMPNKKGAGK